MHLETPHQTVNISADCGADAAARGFSQMARSMVGSSILTIASEIRERKEAGDDVADMTVGDFSPREFPIPEALSAAMHEAIAAGETNYPPPMGVGELREAVREHLLRTQGLDYPLESFLIVGGARPALYAAYRLLLDPGDKVLYPVPSWNNSNYRDVCQIHAEVVRCGPENAFQPTVDDLAPHVRGARLLVLNTPQNPSGGVMRASDVERFGQLVVEENERRAREGEAPFYLLLDQIYRALVFPGSEHFSPVQLVPECAPYVIHVDGISKFCAATGLRVGWMVAPPAIARKAGALLTHVGAWAPRPAQVAAARFLRDTEAVAEWEGVMLRRVEERLQAVYRGIEAMRQHGVPVEMIAPQGAIYVSLRLDLAGRRTPEGKELRTSEDIRSYLLSAAGFALVPFSAFGVPEEHEDGWFRVSVGAVSLRDIEDVLPRVEKALQALR